MIRRITLLTLLTLILSSCNSQTQDEKSKNALIEKALEQWAKNPVLNKEQLDLDILNDFKDSGQIINKSKEGRWVEYSLDTTSMGKEMIISVGDKKLPVTLSANIVREIGEYMNGKREGTWTKYEAIEKKPPFHWNRTSTLNYKAGLKDGEETIYQGFGEQYQKPLIVRNWRNNVEEGIGKIYDINSPYNLQQVYNSIGGQLWVLETYYPSGQLQTKYQDTILFGKNLKYFQEFFEEGHLRITGYYINGDKQFGSWTYFYENGKTQIISNYINGQLDGHYRFFHRNGQIWTERIYEKGRLIKVISNFDQNGKKREVGSIQNGTGLLFDYGEDGMLKSKIEFVDGYEKGSR